MGSGWRRLSDLGPGAHGASWPLRSKDRSRWRPNRDAHDAVHRLVATAVANAEARTEVARLADEQAAPAGWRR